MATNSYDVGNAVQCSAIFTSQAGVATDPTTVTLRVLPPSGPTQVFTLALGQVIKSSTGNFYYNFPTTIPGPHYYRYEGTGALIAAGDGSFIVTASPTLGG